MRPVTACFLDFDHTLFDTDGFFHVDVRESFLRLGIDAASWDRTYEAVWPTGYTLEKHAAEIRHRSGDPVSVDQMSRILSSSFSDLSRYLFPDVLPFLDHGKRLGVAFHLLSFGNPDWQRYKVRGSQIAGYFEAMFFTSGQGEKTHVVLDRSKLFDRVIVIDNNPGELDAIKDLQPAAQTYCVNRVPDDMRVPADEPSRLRFLEARRYVGMTERHPHTACRKLDDVVCT